MRYDELIEAEVLSSAMYLCIRALPTNIRTYVKLLRRVVLRRKEEPRTCVREPLRYGG